MDDERQVAASAAIGVLAAMAMTGMRVVTVGVGLVRRTPPEEIAVEGVPRLFARVPPERREAALEVAHWAFGASAGAAFAFLPRAVRRTTWGGPAYGLAIWAVFEAAIAPLLGLRAPAERPAAERAAIVADHLLYGAIVAARRD